MNNRIVSINQFQLGAISALNFVANISIHKEKREPINVNSIIYSTLLQCGASHINIHDTPKNRIVTDFPSTKISLINETSSKTKESIISNLFLHYLPKDYSSNEKYKKIKNLEFYLENILFAAQTNTSVINMFNFPNINQCKELLPAELYYTISNLLSLIETSPQKLPFPKQEIDSTHIKNFETIIESNLFTSYCESHIELESKSIEYNTAIDNLKLKSKNLYYNNIDSLRLKRMAVSVLPITEKIIGTIFGKIPGAVSKFITKILIEYLKSEKRIVIYQLDGLFETIVKDSIAYNISKK
ncbi:hypothetical protein [Leptospira vanthielii]|uniref:Uncharacterized protein n=1 Tax=Leptospira vanthielii serovar Holland str. Waz Holland = ATCC 700522 TaxID=1218591 RepID=N1VZE4_9LEPT|nr:hypothetical protein [Leptospira vanthielii]EMY69349.1 hypothetical protein LEP1GSC199_1646 [Leptospira vanthielii serovar Holland str. Waz Holland = ATCC 700522]